YERGYFGRMQLERRAIDDQPRRHLAEHRLLGERIFNERAPRRNQVDNMRGKTESRRNLHRTVQLDALGLNALRLEPAARGRRIFRRDPDMALAKARRGGALRPRERQAAMTDAEVDGRVKLGIIELVDNI